MWKMCLSIGCEDLQTGFMSRNFVYGRISLPEDPHTADFIEFYTSRY